MTVRGILTTVFVTLLVLALGVFAYDYYNVRIAAAKGQASYEFLEKVVNQQKAAAPAPEEKKQ